MAYFSLFPTMTWSNTQIVNLMRRPGLEDLGPRSNPKAFYPLQVNQGIRADIVAERYYTDPDLAWLVYISSNIIDPYYGWVIDQGVFEDFIAAKYGSLVEAMSKVHHYQLAWIGAADSTVTVSDYNNNILDALKKYYEPILGQGARVLGYRIRQEDWTVTTNEVISLNLANTTGSYILDERVQAFVGNNNIGNGQITWANSSFVIIQHIAGNTTQSNASLIGATSNATAVVTGSDHLLYNIPQDEEAFWGPVSCFEYERNKNETNRNIVLMDSRFTQEAKTELKQMMKLP